MDVRAENHGRPHQKVRFSAAPVVGRNFLTPGHPGVRVGNVRAKSGPKSLCLCCFFFLEMLRIFCEFLVVIFPGYLNSVQQMVSGELAGEGLQTGFSRHGLPRSESSAGHGLPPQRAPTQCPANGVQRIL